LIFERSQSMKDGKHKEPCLGPARSTSVNTVICWSVVESPETTERIS
jgi:hypothetical protein